LSGGGGDDVFVFLNAAQSPPSIAERNLIIDFNGLASEQPEEADRIDLSAIDANPVTPTDEVFNFVNGGALIDPDDLRYAGGLLQANLDADATTIEFEIELFGNPVISEAAILL
jgi:hypothetical protein